MIKNKPFFRWYDIWIGIFIDTKNKAVYICPLPMLGIKIYKKEKNDENFKQSQKKKV